VLAQQSLLSARSRLSVCIFHLAYQSQAAGTPDSHANAVANSTEVAITSPAVPAGTTYTWNPPVPAIVIGRFQPTGRPHASYLPVMTCWSSIRFYSNTYQCAQPDHRRFARQQQYFGKVTGRGGRQHADDLWRDGIRFAIDSGSSITLDGSNALKISVASGSTGLISGSAIFQGGAHRFIGNASGAITFASASFFTTASGFTVIHSVRAPMAQ